MTKTCLMMKTDPDATISYFLTVQYQQLLVSIHKMKERQQTGSLEKLISDNCSPCHCFQLVKELAVHH